MQGFKNSTIYGEIYKLEIFAHCCLMEIFQNCLGKFPCDSDLQMCVVVLELYNHSLQSPVFMVSMFTSPLLSTVVYTLFSVV